MHVADRIIAHGRDRADHPAIVDGARVLTYGEFGALIRRTAAHLVSLGVRPGDRVGVALKDTADNPVCLLAVSLAGATALPMDWRARPAEMAQIVGRFDLAMLLAAAGRRMPPDAPVAILDEDWRRAVHDAPGDLAFPAAPDAPFLINLSSGTTARARGTPATHAQYLARHQQYALNYRPKRPYRYLSVLPLAFSGARNYMFCHLLNGGTVVLHPPMFTPEEYCGLVERHAIDWVFLVPSVLRQLLALPDHSGPLLPSLEVLTTGGDQITADEKRAVAARISPRFFESYSTSATGQIACLHPEDIAERAASVGRPTRMMEIEIVDDAGAPLPAEEVGRLRCRGPSVSNGFYGGADVCADGSFRNGWYYPGERARIDGDGYVYLAGRETNMILRGGINLYPEEIEPVLRAHPAVRDAALVGCPHPEQGEEPVAFVEARGELAVADLLAHCRNRLSSYKVPARIVVLESLPRTIAGKVRRGTLAEMAAEPEAPGD